MDAILQRLCNEAFLVSVCVSHIERPLAGSLNLRLTAQQQRMPGTRCCEATELTEPD